jgi:hypothetical protein
MILYLPQYFLTIMAAMLCLFSPVNAVATDYEEKSTSSGSETSSSGSSNNSNTPAASSQPQNFRKSLHNGANRAIGAIIDGVANKIGRSIRGEKGTSHQTEKQVAIQSAPEAQPENDVTAQQKKDQSLIKSSNSTITAPAQDATEKRMRKRITDY